jgi:signal transduction histidine kinase
MRMRTMLLLPLLLIPILLTSASLLVLRRQMQHQMHDSLAADLSHSAATYRNLEGQRRDALRREALLLSYQPYLRALMTTGDPRTIQDEGGTYAKLSGADLFALLSPAEKVVALYGGHAALTGEERGRLTELLEERQAGSRAAEIGPYLFDGERLYEIAAQTIYFGSAQSGSVLGYVVIGSVIDDAVARQVSQTASSEIAFQVGTKIVSSTLDAESQRSLSLLTPNSEDAASLSPLPVPLTLDVKGSRFLVDRIRLGSDGPRKDADGPGIAMIVLRSMDGFRQTQDRMNRIVLAVGLGASLAGLLLAFLVARSLTAPLEVLAAGVAAVGTGDYQARLPVSGASEIRALSGSIETMRAKIRHTQARLLGAERLATIGQMASSVSHDLRHYLASVYANAEFLAAEELSGEERAELLSEIQLSVQGTTDLIDSLLLFTRTGRVLHITCESVAYLAERAIQRVSKHPEAAGVSIQLSAEGSAEAAVDAKKIERAIYNLVLNGCQAAKQGQPPPAVKVKIYEQRKLLCIEVRDSGPGVSASIRDRLFDPFVSANKENGIGIGLTLAATIAQEHGGGIRLVSGTDNDGGGATVFLFTLSRETSHRTDELSAATVIPGSEIGTTEPDAASHNAATRYMEGL